jgi:hypothetical protein
LREPAFLILVRRQRAATVRSCDIMPSPWSCGIGLTVNVRWCAARRRHGQPPSMPPAVRHLPIPASRNAHPNSPVPVHLGAVTAVHLQLPVVIDAALSVDGGRLPGDDSCGYRKSSPGNSPVRSSINRQAERYINASSTVTEQ